MTDAAEIGLGNSLAFEREKIKICTIWTSRLAYRRGAAYAAEAIQVSTNQVLFHRCQPYGFVDTTQAYFGHLLLGLRGFDSGAVGAGG